MEFIFTFSNLYVMPFWLLMITLPHWSWTQRIMRSFWPVAALALLYSVMLLSQLFSSAGGLLDPTLAGIAALLGTPEGAATGWVHFLAFDLFVGRWVYLDSRERELNRWLVSLALFFTLMAGPLGLLLYLLLRSLPRRQTL